MTKRIQKFSFILLLLSGLVHAESPGSHDGGRTGVGGGFFKERKIRTLILKTWRTYKAATLRAPLNLVPDEQIPLVEKLIGNLDVRVESALYTKEKKTDKVPNPVLIGYSEYLALVDEVDSEFMVKEVGLFFVPAVAKTENQKAVAAQLSISEARWNKNSPNSRLLALFGQTLRLAGTPLEKSVSDAKSFAEWLNINSDLEAPLLKALDSDFE